MNLRESSVAGMFYPKQKNVLEKQLTDFFKGLKKESKTSAVIAPHAGYEYSGKTAAVSFNALAKAKSYLGYSAFSHDGLVAQLEYEQFSHADAVYGADNSGADWNEQAAKKAKSYMEYSAFSRGSLIEQLKYDKFTQAQAEYGANAVGL